MVFGKGECRWESVARAEMRLCLYPQQSTSRTKEKSEVERWGVKFLNRGNMRQLVIITGFFCLISINQVQATGETKQEQQRKGGSAQAAVLERTFTSELPAEIKLKKWPTVLAAIQNGKPSAVIAVQKDNLHAEWAETIQKRLAAVWGVTFPIREVADHSDGSEHLILFGAD
jgi:hypothetical protein